MSERQEAAARLKTFLHFATFGIEVDRDGLLADVDILLLHHDPCIPCENRAHPNRHMESQKGTE